MDFNDFIYSDFLSLQTRSFFERERDLFLKEEKERAEKKQSIEIFRKRVTDQAIELGLLDEMQAEFLETPTICSLIREYKKYSK